MTPLRGSSLCGATLAGRGLTPAQYREKWNLPSDYPIVAPNLCGAEIGVSEEIGTWPNIALASVAARTS